MLEDQENTELEPEVEEEVLEEEEGGPLEEEEEEEEESTSPQIAMLQAQVEQMQSVFQSFLAGQKPPEVPESWQDIDFIDDEEGEYTKELNKPLNKAVQKAVELAFEKFLQKFPELVDPAVERKMSSKEKFSEFYSSNPHLAKGTNKQFVALLANQLASKPEYANYTWEQFVPVLKKEAERQLNLGTKRPTDKTPAPTGSRKPTQTRKAIGLEARLQSDAQDLLAFAEE